MAQIPVKDTSTILSIREFLGLNENPDGDTTLKTGELSEMRNFKITQDRHLQIRPGSKTVADLKAALIAAGGSYTEGTDRLHGVWRGSVGGAEHTLAAFGGRVWDVATDTGTVRSLGTAAERETSFFAFGGKVYLLNGSEYKSWDGGSSSQFVNVAGYVPIIQIATAPAGGGTLLEAINRLTPKRRVRFSPDGSATVFQLPEKGLASIDGVKLNGEDTTAYTSSASAGTVTMNTAPASGTNTLEVTYSASRSYRTDVLHMKFAELYNGATDTRVFLYGDGSNRVLYSGISYEDGQPSAEYFPDLYELTVGETNTPVTALVRHYSRLMAYKPSSAWVIQYGTLGLANAGSTAAFYIQPVNRQIGNDAPGQVKLLENNPLTLDVGSVYQWQSGGYSTYITANENNAKRVSARVERTLRQYDLSKIKTFNIKSQHEYWFMLGGGKALILNYDNDSWYYYEGLTFRMLFEIDTEIYGVGGDGRVVHFSRAYRNDDGEALDCYAATGAMDFSQDWKLKYSPMIFVAMQPESGARITVTTESNRRSDYPEKLVSFGLAGFNHVDFNHFSFNTNRKPQVRRVKIKVKKATFYRLIYKSNSKTATATVIETDVKLRYAGYVK